LIWSHYVPLTQAVSDIIAQHPALTLIGNTPLVRLDLFDDEFPEVEIWAKMEAFNPGGSLKDRPVLRMLSEASADGRLEPGMTILDSSSGNAGIAYAMIGAVLGHPVKIVIPNNASMERKKRLWAHGAETHFTDAQLGYDEALREVRRIYESDPSKYFFCDQYGNQHNWLAHYDGTANEIWDRLGDKVTHFVAGVGTGGTITGTGRRLKELKPSLEVHCVIPDPFPGVEGLKPLGSDHDIVPEILDQSVIDGRWELDLDHAWERNQQLAKRGLFVGQSSGAYVETCYRLAKEIKKGCIVTILCDIGARYFSTRLWDI
jgi:cysteine synthase B